MQAFYLSLEQNEASNYGFINLQVMKFIILAMWALSVFCHLAKITL